MADDWSALTCSGRNRHYMRTDGQVCINPFHFRLERSEAMTFGVEFRGDFSGMSSLLFGGIFACQNLFLVFVCLRLFTFDLRFLVLPQAHFRRLTFAIPHALAESELRFSSSPTWKFSVEFVDGKQRFVFTKCSPVSQQVFLAPTVATLALQGQDSKSDTESISSGETTSLETSAFDRESSTMSESTKPSQVKRRINFAGKFKVTSSASSLSPQHRATELDGDDEWEVEDEMHCFADSNHACAHHCASTRAQSQEEFAIQALMNLPQQGDAHFQAKRRSMSPESEISASRTQALKQAQPLSIKAEEAVSSHTSYKAVDEDAAQLLLQFAGSNQTTPSKPEAGSRPMSLSAPLYQDDSRKYQSPVLSIKTEEEEVRQVAEATHPTATSTDSKSNRNPQNGNLNRNQNPSIWQAQPASLSSSSQLLLGPLQLTWLYASQFNRVLSAEQAQWKIGTNELQHLAAGCVNEHSLAICRSMGLLAPM
jgi:hypothetical protein